MLEYSGKNFISHVDLGISLLRGKWKALILYNLSEKPLRYNTLHKKMSGISHKVFNEQLKELENDGLIIRVTYNEIPVKVEFNLSKNGKLLIPALNIFKEYAKENLDSKIKYYKN